MDEMDRGWHGVKRIVGETNRGWIRIGVKRIVVKRIVGENESWVKRMVGGDEPCVHRTVCGTD